jgi:hypothetical protein
MKRLTPEDIKPFKDRFPFISLVPIPEIEIEEPNVSFEMEVTCSTDSEDENKQD